MASAQQKALEVMANAQSMPLEPPSGEKQCPRGRVRIGVFFDGTGNNKWRDWNNGVNDLELPYNDLGKNGPTNVAKLFEMYKEPDLPKLNKVYHHGVGSDYDYDGKTVVLPPEGSNSPAPVSAEEKNRHGNMVGGGGLGKGGKARIEWGLKQLAEFYSNNGNEDVPEKFFDIYGFSRGAALSRDFVNAVKTAGVMNLNKPPTYEYIEIPGGPDYPSQTIRVEKRERIKPSTITPKFLGIFDTVASFGLGGLQVGNDIGQFKLDVDHTYVEYCVHLVAEDEFRGNFPLSSIFMDPNDLNSWFSSTKKKYQDPRKFKKWMLEIWYPGSHSDVGGSYLKRGETPAVPPSSYTYVDEFGIPTTINNPGKPAVPGKRHELANIPLRDMWLACQKALVPMDPPEAKLPAHMHVIPGDLATLYNQYCSYRKGTDFAQHTERGDSRYIHSYEDSDFRARFYTKTMYKDWLQPWNWHGSSSTAREAQPSMQGLMAWVHDSSAEFFSGAWERPFGARVRLQRTVLYADAQPIPEARNHPLPKPGR